MTRLQRFGMKISIQTLLLLASFIFVFPFFWMASSSFKPTVELFSKAIHLLPQNPTLDNYRYAFNAVNLLRTMGNSFIIATGYTLLAVLLTSLGGFAFSKYNFPGRRILFSFLLATMMVPQAVGLVPSFILMSWLGWVNTFWALIIPGAAHAFGIFLMRQYINSVPDEIIDSARIDGASDFAIYWRIILPLIQPALITVGIMDFFGAWNDFLWPLIVLRSNEKYTILLAVNTMPATRFNTPWGAVMAGSTFAVIPLIIIFLFLQRYIISGLTVGAVKS